jgi:hypothetical protein
MKQFYIGFSRNAQNKWGSMLLQKYMRKEYSHTFFEFDTTRIFDDNTILHSSMSNGVGYWANKRFEKDNTKTHLFKIEVSDEQYRSLRAKLHGYCGEKYAFIQNLGIIAVDILQNMGLEVSNPFRDGENCSELVFAALIDMFPELSKSYSKNTIRPDHIEHILTEKGYTDVLSKED